ncbi:MAG: hypothetical protein ACJAYB_002340 [Psychromonas sp.]|jgi:hypothetical protein
MIFCHKLKGDYHRGCATGLYQVWVHNIIIPFLLKEMMKLDCKYTIQT